MKPDDETAKSSQVLEPAKSRVLDRDDIRFVHILHW